MIKAHIFTRRPPLFIAAGATFFTLILYFSGVLTPLESISYDNRMRLFREKSELNNQIAVVLIDEASLQAMNPIVGRWPWPRSVYGDLIDFMKMGGARAVVFDLLLTENTTAYKGEQSHINPHDQRLIDATAESGIAFHAAQVLTEPPDEGNHKHLNLPLPQIVTNRFSLSSHSVKIAPQNSIQLPYEGLYQASRGLGVVTIDADNDGVFRRIHLIHNYNGHLLPSLAITALPGFENRRIERTDDTLYLGTTRVPLLPDESMLINLVGNYRPYSISGILASIEAIHSGEIEKMTIDPSVFADKIVFVGASAVGLEDVKATPLSPRTPGVMLHASAASNILTGDMLVPSSRTTELIIIIFLTASTGWGILQVHRLSLRIAIPVLLLVTYAIAAYTAFYFNHVYPVAGPMIGIASAWLAAFAFLVFTEGKDKRRVRNMLSQYVSPAVLAEVVDRYEDQIQAEVGKRVHLSILFSDVRGFTSFSEKLEAEQVVEMLNVHFRIMTDIIFKYQGTLDKFIGDAIMAFWGAPIRDDHHADHAVLSALEMFKGLETVNQTLAAKQYPPIRIGIGINTGDVVLGNIGSEKKLDYTIIGDNVNLGSRLEGLTGKYGCPIIISEYTRNELTIDIPCAAIDLVRVKGKSVPIKLYWPISSPDASDEVRKESKHTAQLINDGFTCYINQRWDEAIAFYQQLPDGPLKDTFIDRCKNYQQTPPSTGWDGIYTLTEK